MVVDVLPEVPLALVERAALHFDAWRTEAFPIADQFGHSYVKDEAVHQLSRLVEVQERPGDNYRRGVEADAVTDAECKNDVQPIGLHIVLVTLVDKLGECLTVGVVFCLIKFKF